MLKYKAEMEGKIYQEVDRFFPSSKTCHVCLNQVGSLPLDIRTWTCEHCKTTHDRDVNAAINLLTQVASYATLVDLPPGDRSRARLEVIDFLVLPVR